MFLPIFWVRLVYVTRQETSQNLRRPKSHFLTGKEWARDPFYEREISSALSCAIGVDTVSLNAVGGHMTDGIPPIAAPWNAKRRVQNIEPT